MRGHFVASAYYGDPPGSALDADGWFPTGDVATIDPDGFMEITDRSKDVIKSGGEWISSITLENIAVSHPDVAEAAVVARAPSEMGRAAGADGRAEAGAAASTLPRCSDVYEGKVAKWWLPDAVLVVDALPHTATGKLQKTTLRTKIPGTISMSRRAEGPYLAPVDGLRGHGQAEKYRSAGRGWRSAPNCRYTRRYARPVTKGMPRDEEIRLGDPHEPAAGPG